MKNNSFTLLIICLAVVLSSCQKNQNERNLTDAVVECIQSGAFPEKIIYAFKSTYDYGEYDLYTIQGFDGMIYPAPYPYKIEEIENKYVFYFSSQEKELDGDYVEKIIEENFDRDYFAGIYSNTLFFFLQCKDGSKKLLYHAINNEMYPYEIPEVRNFSCTDTTIMENNIEIITEQFYFNGLDDYRLEDKIISFFPTEYRGVINVYNRSDSCLFFDGTNKQLGCFGLLNGKDTLFLSAQAEHILGMTMDDSTFKEDPERFARISLESDENISFFSKISAEHYQENFLSLIRDSLFYFPDSAYYASQSNGCIYPKERIQVINPPEGPYSFYTPKHTYKYRSGRLFLEDPIN